MNKEREAWIKQQLEFQEILVNLGLGQQAPPQHENQRGGQNQHDEKQGSMVGPQIPLSQPAKGSGL